MFFQEMTLKKGLAKSTGNEACIYITDVFDSRQDPEKMKS